MAVPARTEVAVRCRLATQNFCPLGIIEGRPKGSPLATSLNEPGADGNVLVRCVNLNPQPLTIYSGTTVSAYTSVKVPPSIAGTPTLKEGPAVPITRVEAKQQISSISRNYTMLPDPHARTKIRLECLTKYGSVFSTGDDDMGKTLLIGHSILVKAETQPIRQPPHCLRPKKEAKAESQVQDLLTGGLIEPAGGV